MTPDNKNGQNNQEEARKALESKQDVRNENPITKADIIRSAVESGLGPADILRRLRALRMSQQKDNHTPGV